MIKALTTDGKIVLGLSARNLELLREGRPIKIDTAEMALSQVPTEILIFYGVTEEWMVAFFRENGLLAADVPIKGHGDD